jgi:very-short-patch-repair endonuclease
VLDFYCAAAKLAVEIDGVAHDMGDRPERDARRETALKERGFEIMRIRAGDIVRNADAVVEAIIAACEARRIPLHHPATPDGPPLRVGEETGT